MPKRDGLYKRGSIWWLRNDPITKERLSTKCTGKLAAEAFRADRERLALDPNYAAAHEATVSKWCDELVTLKQQSRSEGTTDMYITKTGHVRRLFAEFFGPEARMIDVNPNSIDRFIARRREEGAKDHTINKEYIAIRQMCKIAKRAGEWWGDLATLRPEDFSENYEPREATLTFDEVRRLFAVMPPEKVVAVALGCIGARRAELQRIRREDIDLAAWTVHIPGTKTKKSKRTIPVVLPAHRLLLQLAAESGQLPVSWPSMSSGVPKYCAKAGVPRVTPNDLRRSFATWNIEAGVLREDVAKLLGHTSTDMVFKVYGRESAAAFGEKILRQLPPAIETTGTPSSHYDQCTGGPGADSVMITGVSDEARTRDNRSHNPNRDFDNSGESGECVPFAYPEVPRFPSVSPSTRTRTSQGAIGAVAEWGYGPVIANRRDWLFGDAEAEAKAASR